LKLEAAIEHVKKMPFKTSALHHLGLAPSTFDQRYREDADFRARFDAAMEVGINRMEEEAIRRGVDGFDAPVFGSLGAGQGTGVVGRERKYSDTLMIFMLKSKRPKTYRENSKVELDGSVNFAHAIADLNRKALEPGVEDPEDGSSIVDASAPEES
jgi:hypothetical protein